MNSDWLKMTYDGSFFTNEELINNPEYRPEEWFNPFTEPDKLVLKMNEFTSAKKWKTYVIEHYPGIDAQEQYNIKLKLNREESIKDCGKPITIVCPNTGKLKQKNRQCKHYEDCPRCRAYKINQEKDLLSDFIGMARVIEVDASEEASLRRKYKNARRIPIGKDKSIFVINTDDDIGDMLTMEHCEKLSQFAIPSDNRRCSGSLTTVLPVAEKEEKEIIEMVEIIQREMLIEFDSHLDNAPRNLFEFEQLVHSEARLLNSPETKDQLQYAIAVLEQMCQKVCEQHKMSFKFLDRKQKLVNLSEVDWQWVKEKNKLPIEV